MKLCQSCRAREAVKLVPTKKQRIWKCQMCIDRKTYSWVKPPQGFEWKHVK